MKKLNLFISIAISSAFLISCNNNAEQNNAGQTDENEQTTEEKMENMGAEAEGTYTIDPENSTVTWVGNMTKIAGASLYSHAGTLELSEGTITFKDGEISEGNFVVDMTSMLTTDEDANYGEGSTRENLIGHLSSEDFFAIEKYPEATFTVKRVDGDKVHGDLTVRGITNEETIENVQTEVTDGTIKAGGQLTFDRQDYDINFSMKEAQGVTDKLIDDDLEIVVQFTASK